MSYSSLNVSTLVKGSNYGYRHNNGSSLTNPVASASCMKTNAQYKAMNPRISNAQQAISSIPSEGIEKCF